MLAKLKEYAKLSRSFNVGFTAMAPVLGASSTGAFDPKMLFLLFIIGCLGHCYGFALNDFLDVDVDKAQGAISARPLVRKSLSRAEAAAFILACLAISFWACVLFFPAPLAMSALAASALLVTAYNVTNKRFLGTDFFLCASVFALVMFGAFAASQSPGALPWIIAVVGALQVLFMNIIIGGIKDIEHDKTAAGGKTPAAFLGVHVKHGKMVMTKRFALFSFGVEAVHIIAAFAPFALLALPCNAVQAGIMAAVALFVLVMTYRIVSMKKFDRQKLRRMVGIHYMASFALAPMVLVSLSVYAAAFMFIPVLFFVGSNVALHGTVMSPQTM